MRPTKRLRLRSSSELRNLLGDLPRLSARPEVTPFEAQLLRCNILPRSFLEKQGGAAGHLNEILAPLLLSGELERLIYLWEASSTQSAEFFVVPRPPSPRPFRAGRYVRAEHPNDYQPKGSRDRIPVPLSRRDRNLLWYLGEGRLGEGLEMALYFIRSHIDLFRKAHPEISATIPEEVL